MKGLAYLIDIIVTHGDEAVRSSACQVFTRATSGSAYISNFAFRLGATNFVHLLERESSRSMLVDLQKMVLSFLTQELEYSR